MTCSGFLPRYMICISKATPTTCTVMDCMMHLLTHLPLAPHLSSVNWVSIGSVNGLSPVWCQAITRTSAGLLSIGYLATNFNEIQIEIQNLPFVKMYFCEISVILSWGSFILPLVRDCLPSHLKPLRAELWLPNMNWEVHFRTESNLHMMNVTDCRWLMHIYMHLCRRS